MTVLAFRTPVDAPRWKRLALYSPLARIVLFLLAIAAIGGSLSVALRFAGLAGKGAPDGWRIASGLLVYLASSLVAYLSLTRLLERRRPAELLRARWLPETGIGLAAGAGYISLVVFVLWLAGAYAVVDVHGDIPIAGSLLLAGVGAAVFEEIVFRGVLFRIVEEGLGSWTALLVSALFFGFTHIGNPGATVWSSLAIAIEAGLLLGMVFQVTRSLPLCMGMHAGWNFTQGTVYGSAVSGLETRGSWLVPRVSGPEWLTGGAFGFEASVVALSIGLAGAIALMVLAQRRGTLVPWRPSRATPAYHGVQAPAT